MTCKQRKRPRPPDSDAEGVIELNEGVIRPKSLPDFFPSDDFSGAFNQHHEEPEWQIVDLAANSISRKRFLSAIELERAKAVTNPVWRSLRHAHIPSSCKMVAQARRLVLVKEGR